MKINTSYVIAGVLALLIAVWFLINRADKSEADAPPKTSVSMAIETPMPEVIYESFTAQKHPNVIRLYGRSEANREVSIKAETAGLVVSTPAREGTRVAPGTVLCRQDIDARQANVDQARANLRARQFDFNSTQTLVAKGYKSAIQLESLKAAVDGAAAAVKQAEIELDNVNMRAPFAGIFDAQMAEVGDYLAPGQPCGKLIELNPLIVTAELTETQVGKVELGQSVNVALVTGERLTGKLRFIEANANPATRTFRSEIALANPKYALKGGVTADVTIRAGEALAQNIPAKVLTLDDDGTVGVRYLDIEDKVRFAAVTTIDEDEGGIWVTGLPEQTRVIVEGQDFVSVGTQVKPRTTIYESATQ